MDYVISIIIPVYNSEKYLFECVDSVRNQTYKNLEIILIDDGSIDFSGSLCDQYAMMDQRIRVVHKTNGGVSDARNHGLKIARGDYIGFVDADDLIEHDMYETLLKLCLKGDSKLACTGYDIIGDKSSKKEDHIDREIILSSDDFFADITLGDHLITVTNAVWNRLYHRDIIQGVEFPKGKNYGEEIVFNTKTIINAGKCIYTNKKLYHYRIRNGSITRSDKGDLFNQKVANDLIDLYNEQIDLLNSYEKKNLANIVRGRAYQHFLKIYYLNKDKEFDKLLQLMLSKWKLNIFEIIKLPINIKKKVFITLKTYLSFVFKLKYKIFS